MPQASAQTRRDFRQAAELLRGVTATGLMLYVDGGGHLHLMSGESHEGPRAVARQDRILESEHVPNLSGGDW